MRIRIFEQLFRTLFAILRQFIPRRVVRTTHPEASFNCHTDDDDFEECLLKNGGLVGWDALLEIIDTNIGVGVKGSKKALIVLKEAF